MKPSLETQELIQAYLHKQAIGLPITRDDLGTLWNIGHVEGGLQAIQTVMKGFQVNKP